MPNLRPNLRPNLSPNLGPKLGLKLGLKLVPKLGTKLWPKLLCLSYYAKEILKGAVNLSPLVISGVTMIGIH